MRKKGYGKALTLLLVTSLVAGTVLTGCGKKKVDYSMGDDENGSGGGGGKLVSRLDVPESYEGELEGIEADTGLSSVAIHAKSIAVPDTDKMSVVYYQNNTVDNDYKKRVCENFFDVSAGVYAYYWDKMYKGDIERQIASYEEMAKQMTSDSDKSYFDDMIASLKEQLKTASDEREGAGDYSADAFVGSKGENEFMISFMSGDGGTGGGFSINYYPSDQMINYKPMDGATNVYCYSSDYYYGEATANTSSMTSDEAVQKGLEFLAGCGISDIIETKSTDLIWEYSDASYNTISSQSDGYSVNFARSIDGVAPYTVYVYNIDTLNSDDVWYDTKDETFELDMDDNGIVSGYCYDYFKATGDKKENVDILSWADALKALPKAVNTYYTENKTQYSSIDFNDVRLTYYKIPEGDKYTYTPVWVFAQCDSTNEDGTMDTTSPSQLIMLNATTGELINLKDILTTEDYSVSDVTSDQMIIDGDEDESDMSDVDMTDEDVDDSQSDNDIDTMDQTDDSVGE